MEKILRDAEEAMQGTLEFVNKALSEENDEVLPKIAFTAAMAVVGTALYMWLPKHDPANRF